MKNNRLIIISLIIMSLFAEASFSATVLKSKDEAANYSHKSDYATEISSGVTSSGNGLSGSSNYVGSYKAGDDIDKFVCEKAKKTGNTYINEWSNYKLTLDGKIKNAMEFYDFNDSDCVYDFGVYWPDWSRLAIYYTRLSRDIDEVAKMYAKNGDPRSVIVGGEVYRYVQEAVEYPYGTEYYDYYLRNVDGKLMVIECFHENEGEEAPQYIEQIEKYNG